MPAFTWCWKKEITHIGPQNRSLAMFTNTASLSSLSLCGPLTSSQCLFQCICFSLSVSVYLFQCIYFSISVSLFSVSISVSIPRLKQSTHGLLACHKFHLVFPVRYFVTLCAKNYFCTHSQASPKCLHQPKCWCFMFIKCIRYLFLYCQTNTFLRSQILLCVLCLHTRVILSLYGFLLTQIKKLSVLYWFILKCSRCSPN